MSNAYVSGYVFNASDIGELVVDAVEKLLEEYEGKVGLVENQYDELQSKYDDLHSDYVSLGESLIAIEQDNLDKADYIEQLEQRIRELTQEVLRND